MSGTHLQAHGSSVFPLPWKKQIYMICEGTRSSVWLMAHGHDGLQTMQWNPQRLLAGMSHLSRREVPHRILFASLPRTPPAAQSFCTAGKHLCFLVSKLHKEHQNVLLREWKNGDNLFSATEKGKRLSWLWESGVCWQLFCLCLLPKSYYPRIRGPQVPLWQSTNTLQSLKFIKVSFICPLKFISSLKLPPQASCLPQVTAGTIQVPAKGNRSFKRSNTGKDNWSRSNSPSEPKVTFISPARPCCHSAAGAACRWSYTNYIFHTRQATASSPANRWAGKGQALLHMA